MRILYLTESMRWSGGAEQLLLMARALKERGHDLVVACQPGSDIQARAQAAGLPIEPVRMRQDYDVFAARRVAEIVRRRGIEILHAQHPTAHAVGLLSTLWARVRAFAVTRRVVFRIRRNPFSRLKYHSKRISGYVAISEAVKNELTQVGIAPERIEVIPSVTTSEVVSRQQGGAVRAELGLKADPLIATVANYAEFKGQEYLLRAAVDVLKRFPRAQFLLVGRDTEKLQSLVDHLGIGLAVHIAGFRTDVPRLLSAVDVFVLPSLQEGAGTALREAMVVGIPVIGSNVGGIPESIQDGKTGLLVPPGDAPALSRAIIRLLEDAEAAKAMADRGRAWAREQFSIQKAAERMETFYRKLLNGAAS